MTALLIAGLIFPILSLFVSINALLERWKHKKRISPAFVPLVGPVLLSVWVILTGKPPWLIALFFVTDLSTVYLIAASPRLVAEWWQTSSFTRVLMLNGTRDEQHAILTIHSTGHYLLKKSWIRPEGQTGIVGLGEPGRFVQSGSDFELTSYHGVRRTLIRQDDGIYAVQDEEIKDPGLLNYSLDGWKMKPEK